MNKNNFMKAMAMIDEELMQEAGTPDKAEATAEKSENFFTEYDSETTVSGVEVHHRAVWRKLFATAAAFVIAAGAVGGSAYYFAQLKDDTKIAEEYIVNQCNQALLIQERLLFVYSSSLFPNKSVKQTINYMQSV